MLSATRLPEPYQYVVLGGELDEVSAGELLSLCEEKLAPRCRLVLDLRAVSDLDETGVGVLVYLYKRLRWFGGRLRLLCPAGPLLEQLTIHGIDGLIPCFADEQAMLDADAAEAALEQGWQ
ncbi:STAS domain-containing protein [Pseudaeromonas paramecii]|uniref:STAS domain-containing protein n=1 Tax=Pseudaeromonas paramecii TaxID=2138166 RepID=A0ABP8PWU9_9GAMM